jgi:hypothetical protein
MKAIYKKSVMEQVKELRDDALLQRKHLDYILVSKSEAWELYRSIPSNRKEFHFDPEEHVEQRMCKIVHNIQLYGCTIKVEGM